MLGLASCNNFKKLLSSYVTNKIINHKKTTSTIKEPATDSMYLNKDKVGASVAGFLRGGGGC
jgi:hypothetical protein